MIKVKCCVCGKDGQSPSAGFAPHGWLSHVKDKNLEVPYCSEKCMRKMFPALAAANNDPFEAAKLFKAAPEEK